MKRVGWSASRRVSHDAGHLWFGQCPSDNVGVRWRLSVGLINKDMTVSEAVHQVSPGERINLALWAESFHIKLDEFHIGHIETYRSLPRGEDVGWRRINIEINSLLHLLEAAGCGKGIRDQYLPLEDPEALPEKDRAGLSDRVRIYIEMLEEKVRALEGDNYRVARRLQKANWARWTR